MKGYEQFRVVSIEDLERIEERLRDALEILKPYARSNVYLGKAMTAASDARYLVEKVRRREESR